MDIPSPQNRHIQGYSYRVPPDAHYLTRPQYLAFQSREEGRQLKMDMLRGSTEVQETVLKSMSSRKVALQQVLDGKAGQGQRTTLAEITRLYRLSKLTEILNTCVEMDRRLLTWYSGLKEGVQNDVENSIQVTCNTLQKVREVVVVVDFDVVGIDGII